jgi:hypothetical protein
MATPRHTRRRVVPSSLTTAPPHHPAQQALHRWSATRVSLPTKSATATKSAAAELFVCHVVWRDDAAVLLAAAAAANIPGPGDLHTLKSKFGHSEFKALQWQLIEAAKASGLGSSCRVSPSACGVDWPVWLAY